MHKFVSQSHHVILRLVLYRGEVYRLPPACQRIRVRSGAAWVSFDGQDVVLACGEEARLALGRDFAVVSAVGRSPLILEILGGRPRPSFSIRGSAAKPAIGNQPAAWPSRVETSQATRLGLTSPSYIPDKPARPCYEQLPGVD